MGYRGSFLSRKRFFGETVRATSVEGMFEVRRENVFNLKSPNIYSTKQI